MRCGEARLLVVEHAYLFLLKQRAYVGAAVEIGLQLLVDAFHHPVFGLLVALTFEIAVCAGELKIAVNHIPDLVYVQLIISGISHHLRHPARRCRRKQMQRRTELTGCQLGPFYIVAVGFVNDNAVGHLHDAALYALQLIAGTGQLNQQEEIDHGVGCRLALPYSHRLHEHRVVASRLTQHDCLARLPGHAT